jgi:hypothetical protein
MDSKPQPSTDLNIRLRDELQRCLAGEKPISCIIAAAPLQQYSLYHWVQPILPMRRSVKCHIVMNVHLVLGLRMKRDELKQLKAQLLERDKVIQVMRDQETAYLAQADNFKVSSVKIINKIM